MDKGYVLSVLGAVGVVAFLGFILWAGVTEQKAWETFKTMHHCSVVGKTEGQTITTITGKGTIAVGTTSPQVTYHCDDGVNYTRDEF